MASFSRLIKEREGTVNVELSYWGTSHSNAHPAPRSYSRKVLNIQAVVEALQHSLLIHPGVILCRPGGLGWHGVEAGQAVLPPGAMPPRCEQLSEGRLVEELRSKSSSEHWLQVAAGPSQLVPALLRWHRGLCSFLEGKSVFF